jgi:D-alanyl-D-alanine carboxypeptidase
MNIFFVISGIVILLIVIVLIYIRMNSRPLSSEKAKENIERLLKKELEKGKNISNIQVLIESREKGFSEKFIFSNKEAVDRPFHVASVGKAFTATLIGILTEEGNLNFEDKIVNFLDDTLLENLFVYNGKDYKNEITVRQLLSHTSGVADYFEDKAYGSEKIQELVIKEKDKIWKPVDLIKFSGNYQKAYSRPGEKYHYSDTGYILLGLIIEKISGKSFDRMLHEYIFEPLNMKNSYLMFYSQPENGNTEINEIWLGKNEISSYNSLSIDWAGGGIVSTLDDLKIFLHALNHHEIISQETLEKMYTVENKFVIGLYYGLGFMEYRFKEYSPILGYLPTLKGHIGVLGTQMFYDSKTDTTVIMNFGSTDYTSKSVRLLIQVLANVFRIA